MSDEAIIVLREYPNTMLAELARATLEAHGFTADVFRDDCGGMEPNLLLGNGAQLRVYERDAEAATAILDAPEYDESEE